MAEKKTKRIDFKSGIFISNGTEYFIDPESMCYERMIKFLGWMPKIQTGRSQMELIQTIIGIRKSLSSGNDMLKAYADAYQEALNAELSIIGHNDNWDEENVNLHLDFCALFINTIDEDQTVYDVRIMEKKKADWRTDMAMLDFFLLAKIQQPKFRQILRDLESEKVTPEELTEILNKK